MSTGNKWGPIETRRNEMKHSEQKPRRGSWLRLLPSGLILAALAVHSQPAVAQVPDSLLPRNLSPWGMFLHADIIVKAVMIGLAFASLVTWTIWLAKTIELRVAQHLARRRIRTLEERGSLAEAVHACDRKRDEIGRASW